MKISKQVVKEILEHCKGSPTFEACGLLFGNSVVDRILQGKNISKDPNKYLIDPKTTLNVFEKDFKGTYHSHLSIAAVPSTTDVETARYPGKYYLIYSLKARQLRCYKWDGKDFYEEALEVTGMKDEYADLFNQKAPKPVPGENMCTGFGSDLP